MKKEQAGFWIALVLSISKVWLQESIGFLLNACKDLDHGSSSLFTSVQHSRMSGCSIAS